MNTIRIRLGHEYLDVTLAYLNGKDAESGEAQEHAKSLSDVDGTDVRVHGGTVEGLIGALCDIFVRATRQPSVPQMSRIYRVLRRNLSMIMKQAGAKDPYGARVFKDLILAARTEQLSSLN